MISKVVHTTSWLAAVLTFAATVYWIGVIAGGNYCWDAFTFSFGMAAPLGTGIVFGGVIPSAVLYFRTGQRRDGLSLGLASFAFAILLVEAFVVNLMIPQRGE